MLVTGGLGFMGSAFIRYLLQKKHYQNKVVNLDKMTYAANEENVASIKDYEQYVFVKGSINDRNLLEKLYQEYKFTKIVHFAAETHVDNSIKNPQSFVETNILGTFTLLEFLRAHSDIHLHIISTDEVYGSLDDNGYFYETSPYKPNSPYSASKASADHLARSYFETYGLNITISHAANNYGPHQHSEKLIPHMLSRLEKKQPLPIYGNGCNIRDWLFVDDHSEAVLKILQLGTPGHVYNIGGENEWRNIDLIKMLILLYSEHKREDLHQLLSLITFVEDRPGHDFRYAMSNEKIKKEICWSPTTTIEEGLKQTINWYINEKSKHPLHHTCQT